jgi:hemerythrin
MATQLDETDLIAGFPDLDGEHHLQLDLLATLAQIRDSGSKGTDADADAIFDRLVEFSKVHFASEELLMRLYAYPYFQAHTDEHGRTLEKIEALHQAWRSGNRALTADTLAKLREWIESHIRKSDRALGRYLKETVAAARGGNNAVAGG